LAKALAVKPGLLVDTAAEQMAKAGKA
jgi:hypothetical protein